MEIISDWDFRFADTVYNFQTGVFTVLHDSLEVQEPERLKSLFYTAKVLRYGLLGISSFIFLVWQIRLIIKDVELYITTIAFLALLIMLCVSFMVYLLNELETDFCRLEYYEDEDAYNLFSVTVMLALIVALFATRVGWFSLVCMSTPFVLMFLTKVNVTYIIYNKSNIQKKLMELRERYFEKKMKKAYQNVHVDEWFKIIVSGYENKGKKTIDVPLPHEIFEYMVKQSPKGILRQVFASKYKIWKGGEHEYVYTLKLDLIKPLEEGQSLEIRWRPKGNPVLNKEGE